MKEKREKPTSASFLIFIYVRFCSALTPYLASSARKRRKNSTNVNDTQPKNTVAILNELKKNLVYELESQEGPYHAPVFTMSVTVSVNYSIIQLIIEKKNYLCCAPMTNLKSQAKMLSHKISLSGI